MPQPRKLLEGEWLILAQVDQERRCGTLDPLTGALLEALGYGGQRGGLEIRGLHSGQHAFGQERLQSFDQGGRVVGLQQKFAGSDSLEFLADGVGQGVAAVIVRNRGSAEVARGSIERRKRRRPPCPGRCECHQRDFLVGLDTGGVADQPGRHHLHHRALDQAPAPEFFRVLHLLADRYTVPESGELADILLGAVDGDAAHGHGVFLALVAGRECNVQQRRGEFRIVEEHLVKIAHAVEDDGIRMLRLDGEKLPHHRSIERRVFHG